MTRSHTAGAVGLAVVAATAAAVLASTGSDTSSHQAIADAGSRPAIAQSFAVLRDTAASPAAPAANPYQRDGAMLHVAPGAARLAGVVAGRNVWVAPSSDDKLCVSAVADGGEATGGCGAGVPATADGFFTETQPAPSDVKSRGLAPDTTDLFGVVPDGVTSVVVTSPSDAQTTLRVHRNVVGARFNVAPASVRFVDASGTQHVTQLGGE